MPELDPQSEYSVSEALSVTIEQTTDAVGALSARSRDVLPASATPDPVANATQFQTWIDAQPDFSFVNVPNQEIPLGAGLSLGGRRIRGQGPASKLRFTGLGAAEDGLTFLGSVAADKDGGGAEHIVIDMNSSGRDAIRWGGGRFCTARHVKVLRPARDGFHFEQSVNGLFFENAALDFCEVRDGAGRFGVCLRLAPFGPSDIQFINKTRFADCKVYGCREADLAFLLEDEDAAGTDTKIGGGVELINFHGQFEDSDGDSTNRKGAIYIYRGPASQAPIDAISLKSCTHEHNGGSAVQNGGLVIVDDSAVSTRKVILDLVDQYSLWTGFGEPWDLNAPAPVENNYDMFRPRKGVFTNSAMKQFGTGRENTRYLTNGETSVLFDASDRKSAWKVIVRRATDNAASNSAYVISDVVGGDVPVIARATNESGDVDLQNDTGGLRLGASGTDITVTNAVGFGIPVTWSVIPLI